MVKQDLGHLGFPKPEGGGSDDPIGASLSSESDAGSPKSPVPRT